MEKYFQKDIECASRDEILDIQNKKLVEQVKHVWENVPYYRAKMEKAGVTPDKSVSEICDAVKGAMTQIEASGLTSSKMTWSESGEPNKEPKAVVIKNGVYVSAE